MQDMILPILIAISVALASFGVHQLVTGMAGGKRRQITRRLGGESDVEELDIEQSVVLSVHRPKGINGALMSLPGAPGIHRSLLQAWPGMSLAKFMGMAATAALVSGLTFTLMAGSLIVGAVGAAAGAGLPLFLLGNRRNKRQRLIERQLPEALDFLARVMRAGHSLATGLQMMGEELPQPLAAEFQRCYEQNSLGAPIDQCLREMIERVESTDFAFFITAVLIQRQTGGDLSEVLDNISTMVRGRIQLQQHVKARTAEGRFTGYVLVGLPIALFLILTSVRPEYANLLLRTSEGLIMLSIAGGMILLGLFSIRKITAVRV